MTYAPAPMTMPSVECSAPYRPPRALIVDRIKQRFQRLERHGQKCRERFNGAQRIIRSNEKRDTAMLWQRVQEYKNKKGGKFKTDTSRQKSTQDGAEGSDSMYSTLGLSRLKRKLQLGGDEGPGNTGGYSDKSSDQQDPKKLKHDLPGVHQRPQEYPLGSVSVQIVQKFGAEAVEGIETTVNVQSNGTISDSQSVSVNVGSKNIKQETMNDGRRQQMGQAATNRGGPSRESTDSSGLEDLLDQGVMTDGEIDMLLDWFQGIQQDEMDALLENQSQMMSQSPQVAPQQMTSPGQQMTSPQHMPSPGQHMSPQGMMTSQSNQMQQQNSRMLCKVEKMDGFSDFHGNKQPEKTENPSMPRNPHNMTQQNVSPHGMNQQNMSPHNSITQQSISANIMTQQSMRVNNFSTTTQQNISLSMSSSGQQHGFPGNMHPGNNMTQSVPQGSYQGNMPPSSGQPGVFHPGVHSSSGQQGVFHGNMQIPSGQQGGFPSSMRPTNNSANNNNMTSQHIHKLNQVTVNSQFAPQEPQMEPPRLFHPPASFQGPQAMYERSQQLKQLAEKQGGMNSSASMNMTSDIRKTQTFPQYRPSDPPMSQQMNMPSHPMSSMPGGQRLSHMDPGMYSRPNPQFPQNQQSGSVSIMMQQSMQMQHETMMKQRAQIQMQEQRQASFYNRMPDPSQLAHGLNQNPNFSNGALHQSWNPRGPSWGHPSQGLPPQNHQQRLPADISQGGYLPELDLQSNEDLNILDEILSKK